MSPYLVPVCAKMKARRSTYAFNYHVDGVHTEQPLWLRVKAFTLEEATQLARARLPAVIARRWARPYWDGKVAADGVTIEWTWVKPAPYTGHFYEPGRLVPRKKRKLSPAAQKRYNERSRVIMDEFARKAGHADYEAMGSVMSASIQQVIEAAPSIGALFADSATLDKAAAPSIPLSFCSYSRRRPPTLLVDYLRTR